MSRVFKPGEGERLQLGAPFLARVLLYSATPSCGLLVLARGGAMPSARFEADSFLFIHKGQGRVTIEGRAATVVPGISVAVPQGRSIELRNTGTGEFCVVWACASPALAEWFRQQAGPAATPAVSAPAALPGAPVPATLPAARPPRRRGRRGRGKRGGVRAQAVSPPDSAAAAPPPAAPAASPARPTTGGTSSAPRPASGRGSARPNRPPRDGRRGGRFHKVKEVFMGGRWVRITGEGPTIASGE